ncbi:hypothetical protein BSKO_06931 [Bryopsis sp. KO-2023]|nr:hypothetical protein BSKO_06931 [Bryopsis sp. KO-2023]
MMRTAVLLALLGLCWCQDELSVKVAPAGLTIAPPFDGCVCPLNFDPVCGVNGKTFGNACGARCEGVKVRCNGKCPCRDCICNKIYSPQCGFDGKTYGNSCQADCASVRIRCSGRCPCKKPPPPPSGCVFRNGKWWNCGPAPTPTPTPGDINNFLDECVEKGKAAAVAAARAACSTMLLQCPVRPPLAASSLRGAGSASFAKPNPADSLLEAILEGACLSEAENACKSNAFDSISNRDCRQVLNNGPAHGATCDSVQDAVRIFNGQVDILCRRRRSPIIG